MIYINVRGCNGSGKTTLLRCLARDPACQVITATVPDHKPIPITYTPAGLAIIGDYTPAAAGKICAGLDNVQTQAAAKAVIEFAGANTEVKAVLFEGVVVSTIYKPWQEWSKRNGGMIWAFLDTPLQVCLDRIQKRNGGKAVNEVLIGGKHRGLLRVREKALVDGEIVVDIHWGTALADMKALLGGLV